MTQEPSAQDLERRKQVRLRLRLDLEESKQLYEGSTHYVLKDPASLRYHRFEHVDYFLVQMMDGRHTLDEIQKAFELRFRPKRLPLEDLEAFGQTLLKAGLAYQDSPQSGQQLYERCRKRVWGERLRRLTNILYIECPLFDPDIIISRLLRCVRWAFSFWFLAASILVMLSALLLVGTHWETFWAKMPSVQEFFRFKNLVSLWLAIGLVKVLHELGHGLTCKHFGGEVHDMGFLLLCLSPCIYVNVTDAWTLPEKWKRMLVGLAGVYVELMIAALATFLWWGTSEQWLFHNLSLDLMIVCSVNTVMFNGNPLLRYDGYFVLADWLEIPNLRERCNRSLKHVLMKYCLGMEVPPEPGMAVLRRAFFVTYAVVSYIYGWIVAFGVIFFVGNFLPYKLRIISVMMAWASIASMVGWPLYHFGKGIYQRGKLPVMKAPQVWLTASVASVLLLLFLFLPLPVSRTRQVALVQLRPEAAEKVFVPISGTLEHLRVRDGQFVEKGDILAEFRSLDLEGQLEEAKSQHVTRLVQLKALRQHASESTDPQERSRIETSIAQADGERKTYAQQVALLRKTFDTRVVRAPRAGVVMNAPRKEEVGKLWEKDQGIPLCSIGEPSRLRTLVPVEPADYRLLQEDMTGDRPLEATIRVQGWAARTWRGRIAALPESEAQEVPPGLTARCGGPLAVKPGSKPNVFVPQTQHYLVPVDFLDAEGDGVWPGTLSQVKIHCKWRSCAWWAWRAISKALDLGLI